MNKTATIILLIILLILMYYIAQRGNKISNTENQSSPPVSSVASSSSSAAKEDRQIAECIVIDSFEDLVEDSAWGVVNDGVMGGLSKGNITINNQNLTFAGNINTNGGGFSSIRRPLTSNILTTGTRITVKAISDGRTYRLTVREQGSNTSHQAVLPFINSNELQEVSLLLNDLVPTRFGRNIQVRSLTPSKAREIGIILSDGINGPFSLELESIKVCKQ
jgi:hypothetical protein